MLIRLDLRPSESEGTYSIFSLQKAMRQSDHSALFPTGRKKQNYILGWSLKSSFECSESKLYNAHFQFSKSAKLSSILPPSDPIHGA